MINIFLCFIFVAVKDQSSLNSLLFFYQFEFCSVSTANPIIPSFVTQNILQTAVDPEEDKYGFEGENLRNKNLVVVRTRSGSRSQI